MSNNKVAKIIKMADIFRFYYPPGSFARPYCLEFTLRK